MKKKLQAPDGAKPVTAPNFDTDVEFVGGVSSDSFKKKEAEAAKEEPVVVEEPVVAPEPVVEEQPVVVEETVEAAQDTEF